VVCRGLTGHGKTRRITASVATKTCKAVSHCLAMKETFFARARGRMPVAYPGGTRSSSFSANGAIRHMVRGSAGRAEAAAASRPAGVDQIDRLAGDGLAGDGRV
jgi:hypothetical protein